MSTTLAPTLAHRLAAYAHQLSFDKLPKEVVHEAKRVVIDSFGTALGAYHEEPVAAARKLACEFSAKAGATVLGTKHKAPPDWAAFAQAGQSAAPPRLFGAKNPEYRS